MFQVKRGAPPSDRNRRSKYPFAQMETGTYFEVPAGLPEATPDSRGQAPAQRAAHSYARRHNVKFVTRCLDSGNVRVYRVA